MLIPCLISHEEPHIHTQILSASSAPWSAYLMESERRIWKFYTRLCHSLLCIFVPSLMIFAIRVIVIGKEGSDPINSSKGHSLASLSASSLPTIPLCCLRHIRKIDGIVFWWSFKSQMVLIVSGDQILAQCHQGRSAVTT